MNSKFCPNCNAQLVAGQWLCSQCGTEIPGDDADRTVMRPPVAGPAPLAPPVAGGLITSIPGAGGPPPTGEPGLAPPIWSPITGVQAPTAQPGPPTFLAPGQNQPAIAAPVPDASRKWLPPVAAALAVVGIGLLVWKLTSSDNDSANPGTTGPVATTAINETTVVETTAVETTVVETTVETTTATTVAPTTVPSTEPPATAPPRPPWPAPSIPEPPVFAGPGIAWAVSDPLASGMNSDQPTPYLLFAQDLFNKMAADDWAGVQPTFLFQLADGQVVPYTFDMQTQWPAADRLSLLLVDAAPDATGLSGYELTVAVVANFPGSASLLCGHLYSDPVTSGQVIQRGQFELLADGAPAFMPESLLNDPAQIADIQARCK